MEGGIGQLFWFFLILSALQPVLKQRMLEAQRIKLLHAFERKRKSRVITLVHRQESMGILGFPLMRYIDIDDSELVLRAIRTTPDDVPIDSILHTPGGLVVAAAQIARALAAHPAKVTCIVPHFAMSGGTLIALAADEILMDPQAILGPVDPQLKGRPAASVVRAVRLKGPSNVSDDTLIEADIGAMALEQLRRTVCALLGDRVENPARIADLLTEGHFTHDHGLTVEVVRSLGLPVNDDFPIECHEIMSLYPQPVRRSGAVEFLPRSQDPRPRKS